MPEDSDEGWIEYLSLPDGGPDLKPGEEIREHDSSLTPNYLIPVQLV